MAERLHREGIVHHGIELRFADERHRIPLSELAGGRAITIYGQQEVVKDLIAARLATARPLFFEVDGVDAARHRRRDARASVSATTGQRASCAATSIAGCDGFHGVCRDAIPAGRAHGLPARLPLRLARHPRRRRALQRGVDLRLPRARLRPPQPALARAQPALPPGAARTTDLEAWPDERIWEELHAARSPATRLDAARGADPGKGRSRRCAASSSSRCSTGGSTWPATPPTSCRRPAPRGSTSPSPTSACSPRRSPRWYQDGRRTDALERYSETCLRRVWRAEHFSWWMTRMLHRDRRGRSLRPAAAARPAGVRLPSPAAATSLAENYVGLPW